MWTVPIDHAVMGVVYLASVYNRWLARWFCCFFILSEGLWQDFRSFLIRKWLVPLVITFSRIFYFMRASISLVNGFAVNSGWLLCKATLTHSLELVAGTRRCCSPSEYKVRGRVHSLRWFHQAMQLAVYDTISYFCVSPVVCSLPFVRRCCRCFKV